MSAGLTGEELCFNISTFSGAQVGQKRAKVDESHFKPSALDGTDRRDATQWSLHHL